MNRFVREQDTKSCRQRGRCTDSRVESSEQGESAALLYWCHHQLAKEKRTSTKGQQAAGDGCDTKAEEATAEMESFTPTSRTL